MPNRRALVALLLALSCLPALGGTAYAQVSDADKSTARGLATEGVAALDRKDYTTAADRFGRADSILHAPTLLLGLARAQVGLGRWVSAQETYRRLVNEGAQPGSPAAFVRAVEEGTRELDALAPRIPSLTIEVRGTTAARVLLDGAPVPAAAIGVKRPVDPGPHVITASADGFAPAEARAVSVESRTGSVTLELRAMAGGALAHAPAAPGDSASDRKIGGIVALSVGGALVAVGVAMLVLDLTTTCDPDTDLNFCMPPPPTPPYGILAAVGLGVGGAGVVTGAVLLATLPKTQAGPVAMAPVISPGFVGLRGRF
jgi:hypothetical protein